MIEIDCHGDAFTTLSEDEQIKTLLREFTLLMLELHQLEFLFTLTEQELLLCNKCLETFTTLFSTFFVDDYLLELVIGNKISLNIHHLIAFDKLYEVVEILKEQLKLIK